MDTREKCFLGLACLWSLVILGLYLFKGIQPSASMAACFAAVLAQVVAEKVAANMAPPSNGN